MFSLLSKADSSCALAEGLKWQQELVAADTAQQQEEPSFLDRLAAPTVFMQQALLFDTSLNVDVLRVAVAAVAQCFPPFGYRLTEQDGQLLMVPHSATGTTGIAFMHAVADSSALTAQQLLKHSIQHSSTAAGATCTAACESADAAAHQISNQSQQVQVPELADLLFSHLPGSLMPDYVNSDLALVHVALLQLQGGASVLGVRMSHLLGDWASLRLLLQKLAAAYSAAANYGAQQQQQQQECLAPAAPVLNKFVTPIHQQQQQQQQSDGCSWSPVRMKPLKDADKDKFAKLAALSTTNSSSSSSTSQRPVRLSYLVPASRVQQRKQQAAAEATRGGAADTSVSNGDSYGGSNGGSSWCTAHNVLLASVLKAFGALAGRQGLPHDVSVAVDMRNKLPSQTLQLINHIDPHNTQQQQQQQQEQEPELGRLVGNFFASAIAEDCVPESCSTAELAQALHAAVNRAVELWLPDLAWAAGVKGMTHPASTAGSTAAGSSSVTGVSAGEVTWRRLHAMGPKALLPQQMELGLLAALSTTQWPLDLTADTDFAGLVPCLAVPTFSQPQPYPLVLMQQATAAQGGGWMVHVFVDPAEADDMQQAVDAQGGL